MPDRPVAALTVVVLAAAGSLFLADVARAMPEGIYYQGELHVSGAPYDGSAELKVAIVEAGVTYWSNDGTSTTGDEPAASFPVSVSAGIFSVKLGDGSPTPLMAPGDFGNMGPNPVLRVWVDTGSGFEQLPDQPLANALFALSADAATRSAGDFTVEGRLNLSPQGMQFSDGSVLTTATDAGGDSLWTESDGDVYRLDNNVGIGTAIPSKKLHVIGDGRFDWSDRSLEISSINTGLNGLGLITSTPAGLRRDVVFDDSYLRLLTSPNGNEPGALNGLVIDNSGQVGVGHAPFARLDVNGRVLARQLEIKETQTGSSGVYMSQSSTVGGLLWLYNQNDDVSLVGQGGTSGSLLKFYGGVAGWAPTLSLNGSAAGGGSAQLRNGYNVETFSLYGQAFSNSSQMRFYDNTGGLTVEITGGAKEIKLFDDAGTNSVWITGSDGNDDGRLRADVVEITGGSDLSERFEVNETDVAVEPGLVVCIDPRNPGSLVVSEAPYQKTVAGIVSGAGGVKTGMLMGQRGSIADGGHAVALTGRVWAWCDASQHPIEPGDRLTTSSAPGHAMAVTDPVRAPGAVLGKAMTALESGRGLVLVLVGLQ